MEKEYQDYQVDWVLTQLKSIIVWYCIYFLSRLLKVKWIQLKSNPFVISVKPYSITWKWSQRLQLIIISMQQVFIHLWLNIICQIRNVCLFHQINSFLFFTPYCNFHLVPTFYYISAFWVLNIISSCNSLSKLTKYALYPETLTTKFLYF